MSRFCGLSGSALALALALTSLGCAVKPPVAPAAPRGPTFELAGKPFCFAGSNNYYAIYKSRPVVDDLFGSARALGLRVMRVWGMLDRGALDGSIPNADGNGEKDGVYFQYWDSARQAPAYNDGPDGLSRLDYVLDAAAQQDLKLIVVLTNNWRPFGGMDQYLLWYGLTQHHQFFESGSVKQAYRNWLLHLVTRKNRINGRVYRDDPTIMGWELANEPRCTGTVAAENSAQCGPATLTGWAGEMSDYLKTLDPNHLISVGDEGFLNANGEHFAYRAEGGVDHAALTALPSVDFGTFHLYPEDWHTPPGFGERWIQDHVALARRLGKPTLLEEYGARVQRSPDNRGPVTGGWPERQAEYRGWNDAMLDAGGAGALSWMLAARDADGARYPDYDGFAFYREDATGQLLSRYARAFARAPACSGAPRAGASDSPYVSVTPRARPSALGWVTP